MKNVASWLVRAGLSLSMMLSMVPGTHAQANIAGTLYASNFGNWTVPEGNNGAFSWSSPNACTVNSGGVTFPAFRAGNTIQIVDTGNPALTENVVINNFATGGQGCSISVVPQYTHYSFYLTTASAGLQEALNYAGNNAYVILITPDFTRLGGTTGTLTSPTIQGSSTVSLLDERTTSFVPYSWNGTQYVASSFGAPAVLLNQTVSQSVKQAAGTTLRVNSLNQVLYVDPSSGTDLITQVNALITACSSICTIHIPANPSGCYVVSSGLLTINTHSVSLLGDGKNNTCITYTGPHFLDQRLTGDDYDANYGRGGEIGNFTVNCTNPAAVCMSVGSIQNANWHNLVIIGPGGIVSANSPGTSEGIDFQNTYNWMERSEFNDITVAGFSKMFHFLAPTGSGTDSFGYGEWTGLNSNQCSGCTVWQVDAGASVYHTKAFSITVNNSTGTGSDNIFAINGVFSGTNFSQNGEGNSTGFATGSGTFQFSDGSYNTFSLTGWTGTGFFCLGVGCASTPLLGNLSPVGTIANFAGTTQTASVYPYFTLDGPLHYAPGYIAGWNWILSGTTSPTGAFPTSFMLTHDSYIPACIATMTGGSAGQPQTNGVCQQIFNGGNFSSPTGTFGVSSLNANNLTINTSSLSTASIVQQSTSTYGLWNSMQSLNGNWNYGVASQFMPFTGGWYVQSGASQAEGVQPEFEVKQGFGVVAPSVSVGDGARAVYVCTTAGTLPVGALTTVAASCGASVSANLTVN